MTIILIVDSSIHKHQKLINIDLIDMYVMERSHFFELDILHQQISHQSHIIFLQQTLPTRHSLNIQKLIRSHHNPKPKLFTFPLCSTTELYLTIVVWLTLTQNDTT